MGVSRSIGSLAVRIASVGVDAYKADMEKVAATTEKTAQTVDKKLTDMAQSSKKANEAMDREANSLISNLERQVSTFGMSTAQVRRYDAEKTKLTDSERLSARAHLSSLEAMEQQVVAQKDLTDSATRMGVAIGAAAVLVAGAVGYSVHAAIETADAVGKLSAKTGIATETLSGYQHAASMSNVSNDALAISMKYLSKEIAGGSEVLTRMGINTKESSGSLRSVDAVMGDVADKFASYKDGAGKAALAQEVFGRGGVEMINMLNGGSAGLAEAAAEASAFGLIVSGDAAEAAAQFNDDLARLKAQSAGVAMQMSSELVPVLDEVVKAMLASTEGASSLGSMMGGGLRTVIEAATIFVSDVSFVFGGLGREIGAVAAQMAALGRGDFSGFTAISDAVKSDGVRARAELDKFQFAVLNAGILNSKAGAGRGTAADPRILGSTLTDAPTKAPKTPKTRNEAKAVDEAAKGVALYNDLVAKSNGFTANYAEQMHSLALAASKGALSVDEVARAVAMINSQQPGAVALAKAEEDALAVAIKTIEKNDELARSYDDARVAAAEYLDTLRLQAAREAGGVGRGTAYREDQSGLNSIEDKFTTKKAKLLRDSDKKGEYWYAQELALAQSTYDQEVAIYQKSVADKRAAQGDWVNGANEAMNNYMDNAANVAASMESVFSDAFKGMEDAMVSFVTTGKLDFDSLATSIVSGITRIIIQQQMIKPMADYLQGGMSSGSGLGGLIGSGLNAIFGGGSDPAGGANMTNLFADAIPHAGGGSTNPNTLYRVNEKGPEMLSVSGKDYLMMGSQGGNVTPNNQISSGGGSRVQNNTVVNNFHLSGPVDKRTQSQMASNAGAAVQRALARDS